MNNVQKIRTFLACTKIRQCQNRARRSFFNQPAPYNSYTAISFDENYLPPPIVRMKGVRGCTCERFDNRLIVWRGVMPRDLFFPTVVVNKVRPPLI